MRQAAEAASLRLRERELTRVRLEELSTQTICSFIAGFAGMFMGEDGQRNNPMLAAARAISFLGGKSQEADELDAIRGEKVADDWREDPRLQMVPADPDKGIEASNPGGSFEKLMGGMFMGVHGQALQIPLEAFKGEG
jgi:hypothetical protein